MIAFFPRMLSQRARWVPGSSKRSMAEDRTYSTRELAQMWNLSESTVKRWADTGDLQCYRTPGGHRKFRLENISDFQTKRGFEATGLLTTEEWENPDIEVCVNEKRFEKVRQLILYLASQNQRTRIKNLLQRLYMRGMGIVDLYDQILVPVSETTQHKLQSGQLLEGQAKLAANNLEEAIFYLFPRMIQRHKNGKTALSAAPDIFCRLPVNAISRILEVEGWDCLNLGSNVPFAAMAEMVEHEPVNLVCVVSSQLERDKNVIEQLGALYEITESYRIPIMLGGVAFADPQYRGQLPHDEYFADFRSFRQYIMKLPR